MHTASAVIDALPANVVALDTLLTAYDLPFRTAVRKALAQEGFEFTHHGLPNLQLAEEIAQSIGWLETRGHEQWQSFRKCLEMASRRGILVDLGMEPQHQITA